MAPKHGFIVLQRESICSQHGGKVDSCYQRGGGGDKACIKEIAEMLPV